MKTANEMIPIIISSFSSFSNKGFMSRFSAARSSVSKVPSSITRNIRKPMKVRVPSKDERLPMIPKTAIVESSRCRCVNSRLSEIREACVPLLKELRDDATLNSFVLNSDGR